MVLYMAVQVAPVYLVCFLRCSQATAPCWSVAQSMQPYHHTGISFCHMQAPADLSPATLQSFYSQLNHYRFSVQMCCHMTQCADVLPCSAHRQAPPAGKLPFQKCNASSMNSRHGSSAHMHTPLLQESCTHRPFHSLLQQSYSNAVPCVGFSCLTSMQHTHLSGSLGGS